MSNETPSSVLSHIATNWELIQKAREGEGTVASEARNELLQLYYKAVLKFLLIRMRKCEKPLPKKDKRAPEVAVRLASDFAQAVLECENLLLKANSEQGRFHRYLQRVLGNWIIDKIYRPKTRKKREITVAVEVPVDDDPANRVSPEETELKSAMQECLDRPLAELLKALRGNSMKQWRDQLVARVLKLLADQEAEGGPPYHSLVQIKTERPELGGQELADALSQRAGRTISAANVRQMIHRQRERYAELLVEELARSLAQATKKAISPAVLEEKLIEMELFNTYAKEALKKYCQK